MNPVPVRVLAMRAMFRTVGRMAPELAARRAEALFCTPPRHEPRASDEAFLAQGRSFQVAWQGQQLAAWEWGAGSTVLLVHGWGSRAGRLSTLAGALVEAGFRVAAFDAPAHGRSTGRFASLPEFASALCAVADTVGPLRGIVGHSLGGAAATLALGNGLTAGRVVLIAAPADVRRFSTAFSDYLRLPPRVRAALLRNLRQRLRVDWDDLHLPTIARSLSVPVLLVHDEGDTDVPFAHAEEIAAAWPGALLLRTRGLGHRALLRDAAVVGRTVAFLLGDGAA